MNAMGRLKNLVKGLEKTLHMLRVEGDFKRKFQNLVTLAQSPLVQGLIRSFNIDPSILDVVFNALQNDKQTLEIVETIGNILDCFSVERFVPVESERELESKAIEMNEKKLFLAGIYFNNTESSQTNYAYTVRMDIDNTPITLENRNRFWFPGPDGNFELQMRYHRGFIQVQHMVDQAIIKTVMSAENAKLKEKWLSTTTVAPSTTTTPATTTSTTKEPTTTITDAPIPITEATSIASATQPSDASATTDASQITANLTTPNALENESPKVNGTFSIREVVPTTKAHEVINGTAVSIHPSETKSKPVAKESPFSGDTQDDLNEKRNIPRLSVVNNSTAIATPKLSKPKPVIDEDTKHLDEVYQNFTKNLDTSKIDLKLNNDTIEDYLDFKDEELPAPKTIQANEAVKGENTAEEKLSRKKRAPQFDGIMGLLSGSSAGGSSNDEAAEDDFPGAFKISDFQVYTKQFPYPKYRKDNFITGLYLAQAVQLAFFFALIVQVSAAVRNRIWMRESGNSTVN